eukprot:5055293-Alexandrium_andersonii.AAC.1
MAAWPVPWAAAGAAAPLGQPVPGWALGHLLGPPHELPRPSGSPSRGGCSDSFSSCPTGGGSGSPSFGTLFRQLMSCLLYTSDAADDM